MPCPHFQVSLVKRSAKKSAVAGAAYQSGTDIYSDYEQKWKKYHAQQQEEDQNNPTIRIICIYKKERKQKC